MEQDQDEHDGGLSTHLAEVAKAERVLTALAAKYETDDYNQALYFDGVRWITKHQISVHLHLVLRELQGLRQFDPR